MIEAQGIYFSRPLMLEHGYRNKILENTVVINAHLAKDFNFGDFRVEIHPIGDVVILPVFPLDGRDLKDKDLKGAFINGYLGLYMPRRSDGDQFLVEISDGLKTSSPRRATILMQFQEGEWRSQAIKDPLTVRSDK